MVSANPGLSAAPPEPGVNIRCDQENVRIGEAVASAKALGAGWLRTPLRWNEIEAARGSFTYKACYDSLVGAAQAHGMQVLAILYGTPEWARDPACRTLGDHCPPAEAGLIQPFVSDVMNRYPGIHHWEVWNEPNSPGFWAGEDAAAYAGVLKAVHMQVKNIRPDTVVMGGVYDDGEVPISWMDEFYAAGGGPYADVVAFHPYTSQRNPAEEIAIAPGNFRGMTRAIRAVMAAHGEAHKELWATEFGFTTGGSGPVSESVQGQWIADAYQIAARERLIDSFFVYELADQQLTGEAPRSHEGNFALLRQEPGQVLTAKESFDIVRDRFSP
jgi:hypothetical protein